MNDFRARAATVTSTVVIQSKQGIGDVVWHLPYLRAIAAAGSASRWTSSSVPTMLRTMWCR